MSLSVYTARLRHKAAQLLRRDVLLSAAAVSREVICPKEDIVSPPSICLPGQIEKVVASPFAGKQQAISIARGGPRVWGATVRYEIEDATLIDGSLYAGNARLFLQNRQWITDTTDAGYLETASLVSSMHGAYYFGHWLRDDCATYLLAGERRSDTCPSRLGISRTRTYMRVVLVRTGNRRAAQKLGV